MTTDSGQMTARRGIPADTFAHRLMLARAHAGHLSIREAADLCGIGRGAWTNWERGAQPVGMIDIAEVISDKLEVERDWLLFGGQLAEPEPRMLRRARGVNTLRYAPSAVRGRASVRPPGRKTDGRGPSIRRPNIIPRPLTATG